MSIEELRKKVMELVIKGNNSNGKCLYSYTVDKFADSVQVTYLDGKDYEVFCFRDECVNGKPCYYTHTTYNNREYMTSENVFKKFNDFVTGEMN